MATTLNTQNRSNIKITKCIQNVHTLQDVEHKQNRPHQDIDQNPLGNSKYKVDRAEDPLPFIVSASVTSLGLVLAAAIIVVIMRVSWHCVSECFEIECITIGV